MVGPVSGWWTHLYRLYNELLLYFNLFLFFYHAMWHGDLVPWPGLNPWPLHWMCESEPLDRLGSPWTMYFLSITKMCFKFWVCGLFAAWYSWPFMSVCPTGFFTPRRGPVSVLVVCYTPRLWHSIGLIHVSWILSQVRSLLLPVSWVTFYPWSATISQPVAHLNHEPTRICRVKRK